MLIGVVCAKQVEKLQKIFFFIVTLRIFLENNNKFQTISLVRKRFKLFWFLTTRVQRKRFLGYKIEYFLLDFPILHGSEVGPNMPEIEFIRLVL